MLRRTLNLGILAHVDAGKTTLTERLLYEAGVIRVLGRVDDGTTQTDTMALEQERGITIKSAVVSFELGGVTVNLIDTPGHPDFIAEVERVLGVLDGAVLVISAVEGVQAQTPLLMRALQRLQVPTLLFVNKTDRRGADPQRVLEAISERLTAAATTVDSPERVLSVLAENDESLLEAYVDGDGVSAERLRSELAAQTERCVAYPVFTGSARTGEGVEKLMSGIAELLPAREHDPDGPLSGSVFKVERGRAGDKIAYVRLFSGTIGVRERIGEEQKVTALSVFENGGAIPEPAGEGGSDRAALGPAGRPDRRRHRRRAAPSPAPLRPADARVGRRSRPSGGQGRAAHRPHAARGAGSADQPAAGRRPAGALRLALRRGAEGGHPGDPGTRLRGRGRVRGDDDHLRRAAARQRRGASMS